jgi:L-iditol 2-dehydrogenase
MLAALLYGQEDLRLESVAQPTPAAGEVVIQVEAATTCGTDLKVWRRGGHAKMLQQLPTLFGHEAAGHIVALGSGVSNWHLGDRVVANNSAPCMSCYFCQRQEYSLCPNLTWNNGTFAEFLEIPAQIVQFNMLQIPDHLPGELAAMTEPLACVLHGIARSDVKPQDLVVVLGDGAIGLMFVAVLAREQNMQVLLWGGNDHRLEIGRKFGAAQTLNYHQIEATGLPSVWQDAIACTRPGATVNLFGGCPRDTTITVSTEQLHYSELTLKGVFHNTPKYVRAALALIASRRIPFELLISEKRPLQDLAQAFQDMKARKVIKVAITPSR